MDEATEFELRELFSKYRVGQPPREMLERLTELFPVEDLENNWLVDNEEMRRLIVTIIIPTVVGRWLKKNEDYRGAQMFLGVKAQFIDINRKFWKLFHIVWKGHKPQFETATEIKMDMIGHLLMSLYLENPEYWREMDRAVLHGQGD